MSNTIRAFIAIDIPPGLKRRIAELENELKRFGAEVRWVAADSAHITLKFLGHIDQRKVDEIAEALRPIAGRFTSFAVSIARLGAFPNLNDPRVIWVGISSDDDKLASLNADIERQMQGLGFEPEARPFKPHLTLGRVKGRSNLKMLAEHIRSYGESSSVGDFTADGFALFRSILQPTGAVYQKLISFPFAG